MKSFKISFAVCMQNLRKWTGDYKVLLVFVFLLIVNHYHASWFLDFSAGLGSKTGVAPWIFVFAFTGWDFVKIMMLLPLLMLFSNAPFIDDNQPFLISRCTRKSWCFGQILYIIFGSAVYVLISAFSSVLMLLGNIDFNTDWGGVINTAAKVAGTEGAVATGVSNKIVYYFSPFTAMFYTMLLLWFACIFIGLVIYVVNSITGSTGYGVFAGGVLIIFDFIQNMMRSSKLGLDWLSYFSPVSWSSIDLIDITGKRVTPDITFVFCGYAVLIIGLSVLALRISKKQEIKVVQDV